MNVSQKAAGFTESVIREMTRISNRHNAVNLAQGFPDFPCPDELKEAAAKAIRQDFNQYAITWGAKGFRDAIVAKCAGDYGLQYDPDTEVCVCCGSTEAMISCALAVINPGDEVVVFEPFYENYGPDSILCGALPKFVPLREPDWSIDELELKRAFCDRTKAVILNTPNNPTGKVFSRSELELIASLCHKYDAVVLSDEIYEHITFDGTAHVAIATLPGMRERCITINSLSKTYSVTGWRVGWALGPRELIDGVRKVHDFVTVGAPAPLQEAGVVALQLPPDYYRQLAADYQIRRDTILPLLEEAGFRCSIPSGAYYVMTDISEFGCANDVEFAHRLIRNVGVAGVPGSSFYHSPELGRAKFRFMFAKRAETLVAAGELLLNTREQL